LKELGVTALLAATLIGLAVGTGAAPALGAFFHRSGHGHWGDDPAAAKKHVDIAVEIALREVDATPEQIARVKEVAESLVADLETVRAQHEAHHDALLAQLEQPEISREALQSLRAEELALADSVSVRIVDALADAAAALTPEQRGALIQWARELHGHGHGWH
jgi:Spy/CpxP family protein refolding chaperone